MRMYKLIPCLGLFLLLSGGQMIDQADAICCPTIFCGRWQTIVTGSATVTNPKAVITTDNLERLGKSLEVQVSQEMLDAFKAEKLLGQKVYGFIVFTEKTMTGFVPLTREHKDEDKRIPPEKALQNYNKLFEEEVTEKGAKGK